MAAGKVPVCIICPVIRLLKAYGKTGYSPGCNPTMADGIFGMAPNDLSYQVYL